jgi:hypothetical protein
MEEIEISYLWHVLKSTEHAREYIRKTHEIPDPDNVIWIDMYDDSKLEDEKCPNKSPRIGEEYQAVIPNLSD